MPSSRYLRNGALALTALLGGLSAAHAVPVGLTTFAAPLNAVTANSGPLKLSLPQFDPAQGTLQSLHPVLIYSGDLATFANHDGIQDCGRGFTDAGSTLIVTFDGPGFNGLSDQLTSTSVSGLILPGTQSFKLQSTPVAQRIDVVPDESNDLGTGNLFVTVTPLVTTNGFGSRPGLTLASTLQKDGFVNIRNSFGPSVPEPATATLAGLGMAALALLRRRRRAPKADAGS